MREILIESACREILGREEEMEKDRLKQLINEIKAPDRESMDAARRRQAELAKPPGSLGKLEDLTIQIAGIRGQAICPVEKQAIAVMSADNGVWEEGVACAPQTVTMAQTINFTRRLTGVGALSKNFGVDLLVTDMGIACDMPEALYTNDPRAAVTERKVWNRSLGKGTKNLYKTAAMTEGQALDAIETGILAAKTLSEMGYEVFGVGEMGIGNTTSSACLLSALCGLEAERTVGRGGGLSDEGYAKKLRVVETAVRRLRGKMAAGGRRLDETPDPVTVLAEMGGFDIAAMAGAFLGAGLYRLPVVIDGYISAVAALVAKKIFDYYYEGPDGSGGEESAKADITDFMIASHQSFEIGYMAAMEALGLSPMLLLGMRLGEGSGCPIAFKVIEAAEAAMRDMATFEEAAINDDYLEEIRRTDAF